MYGPAMRRAPVDIDRFLESLARQSQAGDRLPPIRDLMKRFGVSQMAVQRAFASLKARGLIKSEVGRGTFFIGAAAGEAMPEAAGAPATRAAGDAPSILLLRRSISIARGRLLIEGLQQRLVAEGARVLELSYTDAAHACAVLKSLPAFDACLVQSTYRTIPIELLAALRGKCALIAVDGLALAGSDVESVGLEWGEPLAAAFSILHERGHRRIAFASTAHPFLSTQLASRRWRSLLAGTGLEGEGTEIAVPLMPDEGYAQALVQRLREAAGPGGRLPFSALVAWGIEDGAAFRASLAEAGIRVPGDLSVVLLGRPDIASEHAGFFEIVGGHVADQVEALHRVIRDRLASPGAPFGVSLMPLRRREGQSVAQAPVAAARRAQP